MTAPDPIALTIVTGPDSAGKARLIHTAMRTPHLAAAVTISNDPGVGVLENAALEQVLPEDAATCLCCGRGGDFAALLERLLRAIDNRRMPPAGHLIFATSTTADPAVLAGEVLRHPYLSKRYGLTGILAVGAAADPSAAWQAQTAAAAVTVDPSLPRSADEAAALFARPFHRSDLPEDVRRILLGARPA